MQPCLWCSGLTCRGHVDLARQSLEVGGTSFWASFLSPTVLAGPSVRSRSFLPLQWSLAVNCLTAKEGHRTHHFLSYETLVSFCFLSSSWSCLITSHTGPRSMSQGAAAVCMGPAGHPAFLASTCSVHLPVAFIAQKLKLWGWQGRHRKIIWKRQSRTTREEARNQVWTLPWDWLWDSGIYSSTYMCDRSQCNRDTKASRFMSTGGSR